MLDAGYSILDTGCRLLDILRQTPCQISHRGSRIVYRVSKRILDKGKGHYIRVKSRNRRQKVNIFFPSRSIYIFFSGRKQAVKWPDSNSSSSGTFMRQVSLAWVQGGWKAQPPGGSIGLGISPATGWVSRPVISTSGMVSRFNKMQRLTILQFFYWHGLAEMGIAIVLVISICLWWPLLFHTCPPYSILLLKLTFDWSDEQ